MRQLREYTHVRSISTLDLTLCGASVTDAVRLENVVDILNFHLPQNYAPGLSLARVELCGADLCT